MSFSAFLTIDPQWVTYPVLAIFGLGLLLTGLLLLFVFAWATDRVFRLLNRKGWL